MGDFSGETPLHAFIRQYGQCTAEEEFDGVVYWTKEQLDLIIDNHVVRADLRAVRDTFNHKLFKLPLVKAMWVVSDVVVDPAVLYDHRTQSIEFPTDRTETHMNVGVEYVSISAVLADLWETKANQRLEYIDFRAGSNRMALNQTYERCERMARLYRSRIVKSWQRQ